MSDFNADDVTPPLGLTIGDRVVLEKKFELLSVTVHQHIETRNQEAHTFYLTRMMPLESIVVRNVRLMWFSLGLSVSALLIAITSGVVMVILHELSRK